DGSDGRAGAVDALLPPGEPRLQLLTDPDPLPGLLAAVRAIGDPYLRFRGYRRLLLVFPGRCGELLERRGAERGEAREGGGWGRLWNRLAKALSPRRPDLSEVESAAWELAHPYRRAWAFGELAAGGEEACRGEQLAEARRAAVRIRDPEPRARALARLAAVFPLAETDRLLARALRAAAAIPDPRRRAETLSALRAALVGGERLRP